MILVFIYLELLVLKISTKSFIVRFGAQVPVKSHRDQNLKPLAKFEEYFSRLYTSFFQMRHLSLFWHVSHNLLPVCFCPGQAGRQNRDLSRQDDLKTNGINKKLRCSSV